MADTLGQPRTGGTQPVRVRMEIRGVVQGVGFRPFVNMVATRLGLTGFVGNDERGVFVEVEGARDAIERFTAALESDLPPLATIDELRTTLLTPRGDTAFTIVASHSGGAYRARVRSTRTS